MNPYQTLGIDPQADADDVKRAYRKQAMQCHPDRAGGSHEAMAAVQKAYDVLSDPERRRRYDETGATDATKTLRERAVDALMQTFNEVIDKIDRGEGDDADFNDPLSMCREQLEAAIQTNLQHLAQLERRVEHRRKVLKRMRRKAEGNDVLEGIVLAAIMGLEAQIKQVEGMSELCDAVLAVLDEYAYEADRKPASSYATLQASQLNDIMRQFKFGP